MRVVASSARSTGARSARPEKYDRTRARRSVALPDVEHRVAGVAEEVDARAGRRPLGEAAPGSHPAALGRAQADHVGDGGRAPFLGEAQQAHEHLGRRERVGQRAVARPHLGVEPLGERAEVHALEPVAHQPPGQRHRVDDGRGQAAASQAGQVGVDEADVEAGVVGDEHGPGAEPQELVEHRPHARAPADVVLGDAGDGGDLGRDHAARVDQALHPRRLAEPAHADRPQLDDARHAGAGAGGLEVEDDVVGPLERDVEERRDVVPVGQRHLARRAPHETRVGADDLVDKLVDERRGRAAQGEEAGGGLGQPDGCTARAQELVQAVRAVERELRDRGHRTYVRIRADDANGVTNVTPPALFEVRRPLQGRLT